MFFVCWLTWPFRSQGAELLSFPFTSRFECVCGDLTFNQSPISLCALDKGLVSLSIFHRRGVWGRRFSDTIERLGCSYGRDWSCSATRNWEGLCPHPAYSAHQPWRTAGTAGTAGRLLLRWRLLRMFSPVAHCYLFVCLFAYLAIYLFMHICTQAGQLIQGPPMKNSSFFAVWLVLGIFAH